MITNGTNLGGALNVVSNILTAYVVPLLITLATAYFLWGVLSYIMAADDEKKITEARHFIAYGLIGLFIIISVWGLVSVIANTFIGSDSSGMPSGPDI